MTADFSNTEFEARTLKAQQKMREERIDALLLNTEADVRYFSGFRTLFWQSPTRPWFLVVPSSGKPIAVIPEIGAALMRSTWIEDVRSWSSPHADDDGLSLLSDVLRTAARIGLLMGRESSLRMPMQDFERLRDALPGSEFCDATPIVRDLRMVKSEAEIATITEVCHKASAAFADAPTLFRTGQTAAEAFRTFKIRLLDQGVDDVPYLVGGCGPGGYEDVISPPTDRPIEEGDILMLDTGATVQGYHCDFDRNWAFGHASDEAKRAYETLYHATEAGFAAARPGATAADLFTVMADVIGTAESDVGRFGHGLGMQLTEPPSNISWDTTPLQAGMVLTLEPSIALPGGKLMVHEENFVIREDGNQWLTERASETLPIIG